MMDKIRYFILSLLLLSCQRSPQYRSQSLNDPMDGTLSQRGNALLTQKVESMGQPKKRMVVFDFWNHTPVQEASIGSFAASELKRGLNLSQKVIIPADLRSRLGTEDFVEGEDVKVAQLIREGRRMGVAVLIIGRIGKIVFRQKADEVGLLRKKQSLAAADLEVKIFDVQAGREMMALSQSGEANKSALVAFESKLIDPVTYRSELVRSAVREAIAGLIPDVIRSIEKMTWQGRIAKLSGLKAYVNAGRVSGLMAGDILKVLTLGEDIYDPASGAYLGRAQGQLKGTLEVLDYIGADGALTQVHTGGNFREGDLVQLY